MALSLSRMATGIGYGMLIQQQQMLNEVSGTYPHYSSSKHKQKNSTKHREPIPPITDIPQRLKDVIKRWQAEESTDSQWLLVVEQTEPWDQA